MMHTSPDPCRLCLLLLSAVACAAQVVDQPPLTNQQPAQPAIALTNTVLPPRTQVMTLKAPDVLSIKRMVGEVERAGITLYTRVFTLDTQQGVNELFNRCRALDREILKNDPNPVAARIEDGYASPRFQRSTGVLITNSPYFDLVAPRQFSFVARGVMYRQNSSNLVAQILAAADTAYLKTTRMLLMRPFMDWRAVRGRIYVVTDPRIWDTFVKSQVPPSPVQTVFTDPHRRTFIVYAGPETFTFLDQAVAYAVATAVLDEYARVITAKPHARLPLFFLTGLAGEIAGLEVIQTRLGPLQLPLYTINYRTYRVRLPRRGTMTPLNTKRLRSLDELVQMTEYPANNDELYYVLCQSRAVAQALATNAPLALINLTRALANGSEFQKEIGLSYMEMQRDVLARPVTAPKPATQITDTGERKYPDYERFAKYVQTYFHRLTEDYQAELLKQRKPSPAKPPAPTGSAPSSSARPGTAPSR
ncbi:MAG: hypothetical protein N2595_10740 [bacterium]|nr:hypothetical protein [bacterium]